MSENKLDFLTDAFSNCQIQYSDDFTSAIIVNPFYNENVTIHYYEEDDFTPFCACFSFQHCHLPDEEDVVIWISEIMSGNKFAIEFFKNDQRRFGGDIVRRGALRGGKGCGTQRKRGKEYRRSFPRRRR